MAESVGDQLREVLLKLSDIDHNLKTVSIKISSLDEKVSCLTRKQEEIEHSVNFLSNETELMKSKQKAVECELKSEINSLKQELLYQNSYSRRENLNFFGIKEDEEENVSDKVYAIFEKMGIDNPRSIEFQRIHRLGSNRRNHNRPIIVRFLRYQEREHIMRSAYKLKNSGVSIMEDFPREIIEARRLLIPMLKKAKAEGKKAHFSKAKPDKLVIEGKIV